MWRPAILQKAETALLDEKAGKLRGLAQLLDDQLGASYDAHVEAAGVAADAPKEERIAALAAALHPLVDRLARAFPNVGLGYYDRRIDCIVAYGPSDKLGYLVGVVPAPDHIGRMAMERRAVRIAIGSMVRGDAMNCMHPIIREGKAIGFAFANESVEDIYRQIQSKRGRNSQMIDMSSTYGLSSLAVMAGTSELSAAAIRAELAQAVAQGQINQTSAVPLMGALGQVEQYVRLFLDNLGTGVIIVDTENRVRFCNEAISRICARQKESLYGQDWDAIMANLGIELEPEAGLDIRRAEQHVVRAMIQRDGNSVAVDLLAGDLPGLPGHRLYLFEEVDRARREGDYFERAERLALAGELATAIAHEIRNPLTVVAGSIQLIPDRINDTEFLLSLSRIAGQELGRVNRIIQGLLGFARFSEPERTFLDLNDLIHETIEFLGWYARKHGVAMVTDLAPGELLVYGDAEHLKQALLNLMMNGIQAMEETGGDLVIRTDQPPGSRVVRIFIEDQGVGIPEEDQTKIWEVFYSSKPGGSGLGLPVVHRIIDAHRGYIDVESTAGKGSCFTVLLPLANRRNLDKEEETHA